MLSYCNSTRSHSSEFLNLLPVSFCLFFLFLALNVKMADLESVEKTLRNCKDLHALFNFTYLRELGVENISFDQLEALLGNFTLCNKRNTQSTTPGQLNPSPVLITYYVAIAVFGLVINLSVIVTICRVRRLWTITNAFVVSLAMADFLMVTLLIPLNINLKYNSDTTLGVVKDTVITLLGVASLLNLAAVTFERFMSISFPLTYDVYLNRLRATVIITTVWSVSIFQALFRLAFKDDKADRFYELIQFAVAVALPFLCILVVNIKIFYVARQHARQINACTPEAPSRAFIKKLKIVKIIALLVGTFTLTWIPYWIQNIFEHHNSNKTSKADLKIGEKVTEALVCSTALLNPLLYGILRKDVREAIVRGLLCQNVNHLTDVHSLSYSLRTEHMSAMTAK